MVKLKVRKAAEPKAQSFEELLPIAAAAARAVAELDTIENFKLSAKAMLRESMEIANTTPAQLVELREQMESDRPDLQNAQKTLRKMVSFVRSRNVSSPPREARRLSFMLPPAAIGEIAGLGSSPFKLFALAALIAAEKFPESFGTAESSKGVRQRLVDLAARRDELFEQVGQAWRPEDVEDLNVDLKKGTARSCFRISKGQVPLHPVSDAGRRISEWFMEHGSK